MSIRDRMFWEGEARKLGIHTPTMEPVESDDGYPPPCTNGHGHSWVCEDVESGEGRSYCEYCLADGDA